ncbi:MAG: hypothetical protein ABI954_09405 [Pyrinomonadaceae bacterium]
MKNIPDIPATSKETAPAAPQAFKNFLFCSSFADDVWHKLNGPAAYEWWYFDALSDDGRDAIVVIFLDNFIFSPRYNSVQSPKSKVQSPNIKSETERFPAIAFTYYRDGKPLYRALNEFEPNDFSAGTKMPSCKIGASEFNFEQTPYGKRYLLNINANLRGGKKLNAALEWLAVESDFVSLAPAHDLSSQHFWDLASPRSDVTGKIEVFDRANNQIDQIQFRGTGYHDHNLDSRWLPATVAEWQWGRAHFSDATAVFYRYREIGGSESMTQLFLVRHDKFSAHDAGFAANQTRRNYFGIKYSQKLEFTTEKDCLLSINQSKLIDASFFYLRFLSEMTLTLGDGKVRETIGITEHLAPRSLKWRKLDWLVNMRIGRRGRGAFLP